MQPKKRSALHPAFLSLVGVTVCGLVLSSLHNYNNIRRTLPADEQAFAFIGIGVVDLALVTWEVLLLTYSETKEERYVCWFGIGGNAIAVTLSYFSDSFFQTSDKSSSSFLLTASILFTGIVVIGNLILALLYRANDPYTKERIRQNERKRDRERQEQEIEDARVKDDLEVDLLRQGIMLKHRRAALLQAASEVAPDIAAYEAEQYRAQMYGRRAPSRPAGLETVDSTARELPAPTPARRVEQKANTIIAVPVAPKKRTQRRPAPVVAEVPVAREYTAEENEQWKRDRIELAKKIGRHLGVVPSEQPANDGLAVTSEPERTVKINGAEVPFNPESPKRRGRRV